MVGLSRKRVFPKTKGDSITGQDRAQKHCDFRFSQIEKKSKVAVLQLYYKIAFTSLIFLKLELTLSYSLNNWSDFMYEGCPRKS